MKLIPQQAPLYGKCLITVQLCDEELVGDEEEGVEFYLLFVGTTQSHLTSTLRSGHDTLHALCPAHDCCEAVRVTLCSATPGRPAAPLASAEQTFSFIQDLAFDMAQFLVSTAGRQDGLEGALLLDECQIPLQECERLDQSLALALHHLTLPQGWSLLGRKLTNSTEPEPQETLLHFAARRGLRRVAGFLLLQPGAREALQLPNQQGLTPACIAQQRGHSELQELLTQAETETDSGTETVPTDARVECHLPVLNTHTLTVGRALGADPPGLQRAVEQLHHLICHLYAKGVPSLQLQSESLHTAQECCEGLETEGACLKQLRQPDSPDALAQGCGEENTGEGSDGGPSLAPPTSECLPHNGQGVAEDRVCLDPNSPGDYHKAEEKREEAGGGVVDWKSVSDSSDGLQRQAAGQSFAPGASPPSCGKDQEETDTERTVISATPGATEGTDQGVDAAEREEEKHSGHTDLSALFEGTTAAAMGHTQSLENSEISESSDSDMKDCSQEMGSYGDKDAESNQDLRDTPHLEEDIPESDGLTDSVCSQTGLPNPSSTADVDDDMQEVTSEAGCPCLTIGGLQASSGTTGSEQSQETAVGDYSMDKQQGDCPDVSCPTASETDHHSGECAENRIGRSNVVAELVGDKEVEPSEEAGIFDQGAPTISDINSSHLPLSEPTVLEENSLSHVVDCSAVSVPIDSAGTEISSCRASPVTMTISGNGRSEGDSGMALSSDEEDTFRSVNSSLTEISHLSEDTDRVNMEVEQDRDGFKMAERDLVGPEEDTHDSGFPLEQSSDALTATDCEEASATLPAVSPSHCTMEPLISEKTPVTMLEPSVEMPSLELVSAGTGGVQPFEIHHEPVHVNDSDLTAKTKESRLGSKVIEEFLSPSMVPEGSETTVTEEEALPLETTLSSEVVFGQESRETDLQSVLPQLSRDTSEMTMDGQPNGQPAIDEDLNLSGPQLDDVTVDLAAGLASSENLGSQESSTAEVVPDVTTEGLEEAPQNSAEASDHLISPQVVVVSVIEGMLDGQGGQTSEDVIHRDKQQTAYPLALRPCEPAPNTHSDSPRSSVCPSVSSAQRDSGSDSESFLGTDAGEDGIFRKGEDAVTGGDSTSEVSISCSSTDDTASVGPASSSPESCVEGRGQGCSWSPEEGETGASATGGGGGGGGETEEEAKDRLTEVPRRSSILRPSIRSLSPFRRHSWGPGKNAAGEADMNQRSSIRSPGEGKPTFHRRSYSLEGLSAERDDGKNPPVTRTVTQEPLRGVVHQHSEERGSLVSLTEEHESDLGERGGLDGQKSRRYRPLRHSCPPMTLPLTKSVSMLAISQRETDAKARVRHKRRISFSFNLSPILPKSKPVISVDSSSSEDEEDNFSMRSFSSASGSLAYSISEEEPGPLRTDGEGKSGTKVSRTFSYLKSKMYKKTREKEGGKSRDKEREAKEREKRTLNGHLFTIVNSAHLRGPCHQCNKAINTKEAFLCTNCNAHVHKGCRENLPLCAKVKMKQLAIPDSSTLPAVILRSKPTGIRERPRSAILCPEDHSSMVVPSRRHTSIMPFHSSNLSKSISISNIAGPVFEDIPMKGLRYLSQSTDSLHKTNLVNESTESLTDEGTEMMDSQLMGEFEADVRDLEADSWTFTVEETYLRQLQKDVIKRQDVIYELIQTEMHHVRTLRIMAEVYSKGLQKEVQLEVQTLERVFPVLDELLELHTQLFTRLLERKRDSQQDGGHGGLAIHRIGDILVNQFSGSNAECMKRVYGKFCSRHNEAVNFYKELLTKDKRFQAFIKKKMSSSIVRRLGIPECILLVTQRITKYPVLMQRILQHTNEEDEDHADLTESLRLVKEVLAAVDSKVNEHEKKRRLKEIYSRTDSKSIMRMKSGQMFAREDLVRGRRLMHDGPLQLKNTQGRLKDVQAMLLSDIFVFLQEKDQKYVFASLDQRSTVISLQKLIVREVANEERGLFLITAGIEKPEMVEVLASTKEERNTWMQLIQDAMHSMEKDEDEGIPSETEEDKRQLETKAKEMRDMLRKKDEQIVALLEEKMKVFREMCECGGGAVEEASRGAVLFRASGEDVPRGEPIMKDALQEVETLQALVNGSLGGAVSMGPQQVSGAPEAVGGGVGPVCLPRRAETFGGFDSHQMNISKNGDKEEEVDATDLRRTESDSVLKKGGHANLLLLLKRNSEQVLHSVTHLHDLLNTLQAVVVQQDTFMEDQRQALTDRPPSSASSASSSRASSRPNSLIEQEKQRSLEKHRQEMASLQRQQSAHADERRRREREWDLREQQLTDREVLLHVQEEETGRRRKELEEERQELLGRKEDYQKDLERLRDAQRKLDRDREQVLREMERMEQLRLAEKRMQRTPSSTSEDSLKFPGGGSLSMEPGEDQEFSTSPRKSSKAKSLNPFSVRGSAGQSSENQIPARLLQLARSKDKKEKKKKKGKGQGSQAADSPQHLPESTLDGEIFFC